MRRWSLGILLMALFALIATSAFAADGKPDTPGLLQQIADLTSRVDAMEEQDAARSADIVELQDSVADLQTRLAEEETANEEQAKLIKGLFRGLAGQITGFSLDAYYDTAAHVSVVNAVLTFTSPLSSHKAEVLWGDGTPPEQLEVKYYQSGSYRVFASHTYQSGVYQYPIDKADPPTVKFAISDSFGQATDNWTVLDQYWQGYYSK